MKPDSFFNRQSLFLINAVHIYLYSTLGCHLCEQAKAVIEHVLADKSFKLSEIDIAEKDQLLEQYGLVIPVVQFGDDEKRQLGWPFDEQQFSDWLRTF
ncbi:glutaredoxin family protein [Teredinibacter turnerae]|uniref:glutaredoxin family protein n=1 Tax=Teredinibacter turnerae TaxID=2426 RepID=UPI0030D4851E